MRPPTDGAEAYWSWRTLNDGLQAFVHDDVQAQECMGHLFGKSVLSVWQAFPLPVMRADMWRYAILYAFGGIYADIDVLALHPMEQWLPPVADGKHWPPGGMQPDTAATLFWSNCSIVIALENDLHFCQWVRIIGMVACWCQHARM